VFFGRFVAVLRTLSALLAGINGMDWRRFLFFNATGGIVWAASFGVAAYILGERLERMRSSFVIVTMGIAAFLSACFHTTGGSPIPLARAVRM